MPKTINAPYAVMGGLSSALAIANPTPPARVMVIETDTLKWKLGDGTTTYNALRYASANGLHIDTVPPTAANSNFDIGTQWLDAVGFRTYMLYSNTPNAADWRAIATLTDLQNLGGGDMMKAVYAKNAAAGQGWVDKAVQAQQLAASRTISASGEVTGSVSFDGTQNVTLVLSLSPTGVISGTYTKLTVDAKGRVTGAANLSAADIPALPTSKITGLGTAASKNTGISAGNVIIVGADGKIDSALIPQFAITQVHVVEAKANLLTIANANVGDVGYLNTPAIGESITWILSQLPSATEANWLPMQQSGILKVNNQVGPIVMLTTSDIGEGSNLYWTDARFSTAFSTTISATSVSALSDGAHVMMDNVTYIIDGGFVDVPETSEEI